MDIPKDGTSLRGYAVSKDGVIWEKPDLGLVTLQGSTRNNIVPAEPGVGYLILDGREEDPSRRYKGFVRRGTTSTPGMQLDLFTALAAAPLTAQQLAAAPATDAPRLRVLLYALVNAGLLTVEDECFANTAEAEAFLVRGREGSMLERHHLWSELWRALGHTADSIRDGRPHAR